MQKHLWYWALLKQARGFQIFIYLFILQLKHWQSERTKCMAARLLDFAYPNDADWIWLNDAFYPHLKSGYNNSDFIPSVQIDRRKSFKAQLESCPCLWIAGTDFTSMRCLLGCWRIEPTLRSFGHELRWCKKNTWKSIFGSKYIIQTKVQSTTSIYISISNHLWTHLYLVVSAAQLLAIGWYCDSCTYQWPFPGNVGSLYQAKDMEGYKWIKLIKHMWHGAQMMPPKLNSSLKLFALAPFGQRNHLKVYKSESMWKSETHCTIAGLNPGLICFLWAKRVPGLWETLALYLSPGKGSKG